MPDQQGRQSSDSIAGLIGDIRRAAEQPTGFGHRYFHETERPHQPHRNTTDTCHCGASKFTDQPRCPTCAHETGLINQRTMQGLLMELSGQRVSTSTGSTVCACGRKKVLSTTHCKACAIRIGIFVSTVEPGEEPCPNCGDGKKPAFAYCTGCAIAEGYIDQQGRTTPECPTDACKCGEVKYAVFSKCAKCAKGITGFRHSDWTTGPNPVRVFSPLPDDQTPSLPITPKTAPAATPPPAPEQTGDTKPCYRCEAPTPSAKRFCKTCLQEMGAPTDAYDSDFNDRAKYEERPEHQQVRG